VALSAAVWGIAALLMFLTNVPEELSRPPQPAALQPAATTQDEQAQAPATATQPAADTEDPQVRAEREAAEHWMQTATEWLGRAWPVLLLAFALLIAASTWLMGAQIGYLAKIVQEGTARLAEFWQAGTRAFGALLVAWLLTLGAVIVLGLVVVLLIALLALIAGAAPAWVGIILSVVIGLGAVVAFIWLAIRLVFWYPAIVVARVGPLAGLKASFRASRGRWWKLCGLVALLGIIVYGVALLFALLEGVSALIGGGAGRALGVVISLLGAVANLYLGFVGMAAILRFYLDVTSSASAPAAASAAPAET